MNRNHPIAPRGLDHVVLRVRDIERSRRFYTDVLGLSLERVIEDAQIYQMRCGQQMIDLCALPDGTDLAASERRGVDHVCILVDAEVDEMVRYLKEQDIPIAMGPVELYGGTGFGTSIYILDPDEHKLELKASYTQYPLRTKVADAVATLTRPKP